MAGGVGWLYVTTFGVLIIGYDICMNTFYTRSACGLVFLLVGMLGLPVLGQDEVEGPDTLFLTWFKDPTTSMVVQYLEEGDPIPLVEGASDEVPAFDVPRVSGIEIDGRAGDWGGRGFDPGMMRDERGMVFATDDASAKARIGWDERGLLLMIRVKDDSALESDDIESLWAGDSIECFIGKAVGSDQRYQALIAPGADTKQAATRQWQYDYRKQRVNELAYKAASSMTEDGYVIEVLLPWRNLGVDEGGPKAGDTFGFQFYVNDLDVEQDMQTLVWFRAHDAHENPDSMYSLRLVGEGEPSGKPVRAWARINRIIDKGFGTEMPVASMYVIADDALAGKTLVAKCGGEEIGRAIVGNLGDLTGVDFSLKQPAEGERWGTITVEMDGEVLAYATIPAWMKTRKPEARVAQLWGANGGDVVDKTRAKDVPGSVWTFDEEMGLYVHRFEFEGLKPAGEYQFTIDGLLMNPLRFRTAPVEVDGPFVFAEGGDVGWGANVAPLHKIAASWEPWFGFIGGDCAYANGRTPESWVKYLRLWRENMVDPQGRLIPMVCAIGNHEVDGSYGQPRSRSPYFLTLFSGLYPEVSYATMDFGDYLSFVLLDSGHLESHESQVDWLKQVLAARQDVPHLFTAYHVPAYPSHRDFDGKYSELARRYWVPVFEEYGVDVSFEHHDHTYKRTHVMKGGKPDADGVLYMGDGAWGQKPREVATPEERPYLVKSASASHVIRVTLDGDKRSFVAVDVDGNVIDRYPEED